MMVHEKDKYQAVAASRRVLEQDLVVFDTETTGLDGSAEIVEISCVNGRGDILLDTLVRPAVPIPADATAIHGITNDDVTGKPSIVQVMEQLDPLFGIAQVIASYNLSYDYRILRQSLRQTLGREYRFPPAVSRFCIMEAYAAYYGEWNDYYGDYKWQRLDSAMDDFGIEPAGLMHRSLADTLGALAVLRHMAGAAL